MTAVEGLDKQNGVTLGRILGRGTVGTAEEGADGVMRATVRIPEDQLVYEPGVLVMPHAGTLELERPGVRHDQNPRLVDGLAVRDANRAHDAVGALLGGSDGSRRNPTQRHPVLLVQPSTAVVRRSPPSDFGTRTDEPLELIFAESERRLGLPPDPH